MEDVLSVKIDLILLLRHLMIWESILLLDLLEVGIGDRGFVLIVRLSMQGLGRIVIFVGSHLVGRLRKGDLMK
jgi:hypothetical protein